MVIAKYKLLRTLNIDEKALVFIWERGPNVDLTL